MKGRQRLAGSIMDPERLHVIQTAFDGAWDILKPWIGRHPRDQEAARLKLADVLLSIEIVGAPDAVRLRDQAIHLYHQQEDRSYRELRTRRQS